MKKIALYTFLLLSSLLVADDVIKYEVQPTIGYNSFDNASKMKDTFMYGIRGTIYPNSYYGYRLSYERSDDVHYDKTSTKKTTDLQRIAGQLLVRGEEEYQVIPYLLLGGGYEILSDETTNDVSQAYVEGGIGFKYITTSRLTFDVEAKAMKKFDTDDLDYMVNFGLGYLFDPSIKKPIVYQPNLLAKSKKEVLVTPKVINKSIIMPKVEEKIDAKYTFNEEQNIPDISIPVQSSPTIQKYDNTENKLYYVQMAAWFNKMDNKLLDKLERKGFSYEIVDAIRHGKDAQLVKVGPYESVADAKVALNKLKRVKKDAYITKLK